MAAENLHAKLAAIQAGLKAPKSQYNEFGKYKYRKAEDILEAVKPLLAKHGCCLTCTDELLLIGDRYYIKATASITDGTASAISTSAFAREELDKKGMDQSQVTGASSSYARKFALNGLLCIDDTQDSDTTNVGQAPERKLATKKGLSGVSSVSQPIQPGQPIQKPASKLAGLSAEKRAVWVEKVARREKTKDGVPAMTAFLKAFNPTAQELNEFNDEVFNYAVTHSNEIDNPEEFQH